MVTLRASGPGLLLQGHRQPFFGCVPSKRRCGAKSGAARQAGAHFFRLPPALRRCQTVL